MRVSFVTGDGAGKHSSTFGPRSVGIEDRRERWRRRKSFTGVVFARDVGNN